MRMVRTSIWVLVDLVRPHFNDADMNAMCTAATTNNSTSLYLLGLSISHNFVSILYERLIY